MEVDPFCCLAPLSAQKLQEATAVRSQRTLCAVNARHRSHRPVPHPSVPARHPLLPLSPSRSLLPSEQKFSSARTDNETGVGSCLLLCEYEPFCIWDVVSEPFTLLQRSSSLPGYSHLLDGLRKQQCRFRPTSTHARPPPGQAQAQTRNGKFRRYTRG